MNAITAAIQEEVDRFDSEALGPCGSDSESTLPNLPRSAPSPRWWTQGAVRGVRGADGCARPSLQCIGIGCCGRSAFVPNSCVPKPGRSDPDWIGRLLRCGWAVVTRAPTSVFVLEACAATLSPRRAAPGGRKGGRLSARGGYPVRAGAPGCWGCRGVSSSTIRREQRLRRGSRNRRGHRPAQPASVHASARQLARHRVRQRAHWPCCVDARMGCGRPASASAGPGSAAFDDRRCIARCGETR